MASRGTSRPASSTERTDLAGDATTPTTWDELKAEAKALKDAGAEYGISLGTKNSQEYLPFVWQNGGDVMTADGTAFALDSPEAIEALTFYDSFFEEGLSPTSVPEGFDVTPAFVSGTHPMFFSGPWHVGLITEAGGADIEGKWALSTVPSKVSATSFVGGSNLVVFKDSENKDAAWAFVEFMSRPETQVAWYQEATVLPAVQSAWDDPALSGDANVAVFGEQLADTKAPPAISTWNEVAQRDQRRPGEGHDRQRVARGRRQGHAGGRHRHRHGRLTDGAADRGAVPGPSDRAQAGRGRGSACRHGAACDPSPEPDGLGVRPAVLPDLPRSSWRGRSSPRRS